MSWPDVASPSNSGFSLSLLPSAQATSKYWAVLCRAVSPAHIYHQMFKPAQDTLKVNAANTPELSWKDVL